MHLEIQHNGIRLEQLHLLHRLLTILCFADDLNRKGQLVRRIICQVLRITECAPTHGSKQGRQAASGSQFNAISFLCGAPKALQPGS